MNFAPILLFVYNRPQILKKTLKSLKKNKLIKKANIYIFSDGPKNNTPDKIKVKKVRSIINGLKSLNIKKKIFYNENRGLKKNILEGINFVFRKHKSIIVIEDDLILSPYFYIYMNNALKYTKNKKNIWHVSGWNYPIKLEKNNKNSSFLWNNMNCWGWGTHKKYWKKIITNSDFFIKKFSQKKINEFNLSGSLNNWSQILKNKNNIIQTWAIFWSASIFWHKGLCLNPGLSFTKNIGFSKNSTNTNEKIPQPKKLNYNAILDFPENEKINTYYIAKIRSHLRSIKGNKRLTSIKKRFKKLFII